MTVTLSPVPYLQFMNPNNTGSPAAGFQLFTYQAGTSTKQATWTDSTQTVQNPNPIVLDSNGVAVVWPDPSLIYKYVLTGPNDTDPPTSPLRTTDNLEAPLTNRVLSGFLSGAIGPALYPQTAAETAASVRIINFLYPPGHVDRYGTNTTPGSTDMTAAFQASINQARNGGVDVVWGETGIYALATGALDCTFTGSGAQYGLNFRQISTPGINFPPNTRCGILVLHSAYAVFDLTGCNHFTFYDLSLVTTTTNAPSCCFLVARNSSNGSLLPRFYNTTVVGDFTVSVLYNYGAEDGMYVGNYWANYGNAAGCNCVVITANNFYKTTANFFTSSFTTIATGSQSCIGHSFYGGDYALHNTTTTSDTFYLEGSVSNFRLRDLWISNSNPGSTQGRSLIHNDATNGGAVNCLISGVRTEVSHTLPVYGVLFDTTTTANAIGWTFRDSYFDTGTYTIYGGAGTGMTAIGFVIEGIQETTSNGLIWNGTVQDSFINWNSVVNLHTSLRNTIIGTLANITINTNSGTVQIAQSTGSVYASGSIGMAGATAASQSTGWGSPVGGAVINNYNITDAGGANSNTNKALALVISQLKAIGLFSA